MELPNDLLYSKEHVWVRKEDGKVRIGVTDFAQDELGDIVFAELPSVGEEISLDEPFGNVESIKTVSELYAPVSGKVTEVNEQLEDSPEFINNSPYDKAWMIVVEPADNSQLDNLLTHEQYMTFMED